MAISKTPKATKPKSATKTKVAKKTTPVAKKVVKKVSAKTLLVELNGQTLEIKNEGQKKIYLIRKAYLEGSLSVSDNPTPEIQRMLNQPISIKPKLFKADAKDQQFLKVIIQKVEDGTIKLFTPATLLNQSVYDGLPADIKARADYDILVLIHKIRQVKKLWDDGSRDSYQIMNLVHSLRLAKESLESQKGDVFVI